MTTMHVPLILALLKTEFNTPLSFVITETNVPLDLVMLSEDANTWTKFVTITTCAQLTLAQMETAYTLQLFANNKTAKLFLVILLLENVSMLMLIVMTAMHVPLILVI
jgi:hypothetical protein